MIEIKSKQMNIEPYGIELKEHSVIPKFNSVEVTRKSEVILRNGVGYFPVIDIEEEQILAEFKEDHQKYKLLVKEIINSWDKSSNNDFLLYIEVLRMLDLCEVTQSKENIILKFKKDKIKYIPSSESISRSRRAWNQSGECLPSNPRILELRRKRESAIRRYFSQKGVNND